jgi:hypothetical protein
MLRDFKPVTEKDLALTPEELETIVKGAQKFLPPTDEDGEPIKNNTD